MDVHILPDVRLCFSSDLFLQGLQLSLISAVSQSDAAPKEEVLGLIMQLLNVPFVFWDVAGVHEHPLEPSFDGLIK